MRGALAARRLAPVLAAPTVRALTFSAGPAGTVAVGPAAARAVLARTEPGAAAACVVESAEMLRAATLNTHSVRTATLARERYGRLTKLTFGGHAVISVSVPCLGTVSRASGGILGPVGSDQAARRDRAELIGPPGENA
jgi:hypothetical protein